MTNDVPDFDSYPVEHSIVKAAPIDRGVSVTWDDGLEAQYHAIWLRENSADAETTHPVTREQALQLVDIPEELQVGSASPDENGGLTVRWSTGEESRYHPGWLRAYTTGTEDLFTLPGCHLWDGDFEETLPRFDGSLVLADETEFGRWAEALKVYGVAVLEGLPAEPDVIETVPQWLGPIRVSNFGRVFDVQSRSDADSNAYTSMALPLHSDLFTREYVPGLQFLHCLENEAEGGDSLLADGFHIAGSLKTRNPDLYEFLTETPIPYCNKAKDTDYRWTAPLIKLGDRGEIEEVRWAPWLRAPAVMPFDQTDKLYRALRAVFTEAERPENRIKVRLSPGDLLGFDNRRVLHGRTGFDPSTGNRWLRGCYVEREELDSRLRILARHRRANRS